MTTRPTLSPTPAEPLAEAATIALHFHNHVKRQGITESYDVAEVDFREGFLAGRASNAAALTDAQAKIEVALKSSADGDVIAWPSDDPESGGIGLDDLVVQMLEESGEHELVAQFDLAARLPSVWVNASLGEDGVLHLTRHDTEDAALKGPST
jgi:hypothetical protein